MLDALAELEFEDFLPRVQAELRRFNEVQTGKRNEYRRKLKEKEGNENGAGGARSGRGKEVEKGLGDGEERAAKRVRREGVAGVVNGASSNSTDKGVASEEVEEVEEIGEDEEVGKEDTIEDEGADDDEGMEEEDEQEEEEEEGEEDNSAGEGSGEERATDHDELDEADSDERTEVDDEEESSEDSE